MSSQKTWGLESPAPRDIVPVREVVVVSKTTEVEQHIKETVSSAQKASIGR